MNNDQIKKKKLFSKENLIRYVEKKYLKNYENYQPEIGDIIRLGYSIPEGEKERIQYYEGLVIAINNHGLSKSFCIRRTVQGIGIEQVFVLNSPKIISINLKNIYKVKKSKLYFLNKLKNKYKKLKTI